MIRIKGSHAQATGMSVRQLVEDKTNYNNVHVLINFGLIY